MGKHKNFLTPRFKNGCVYFSETRTLASKDYFYFIQCYPDQPKRKAIINIIRKNIFEKNLSLSDLASITKKYGKYDERRIARTLHYVPEEPIVEALCSHFKISTKVSIDDIIANYDFEKKAIAHRRGRITKENQDLIRDLFIEEFNKSWSKETVLKYKKKIDEYMTHEYLHDDWIEALEDRNEKAIFRKLQRIYWQYPDYVEAFCRIFEEEL